MKHFAIKVVVAVSIAAWVYLVALVAGVAFGELGENHYYWTTLRDGAVDVCADERADWVEQTIEDGWGIQVKHNCDEPDLIVTFEDELWWLGKYRACGLTSWGDPCEIRLSLWCHEHCSNFVVDVPEITLLHEFGHCAGYLHTEGAVSVMQPTASYMPTDEDIKAIYGYYGLTIGLVPEPQSGAWTMARWSGPPTESERLTDVAAVYYLDENEDWLRYIDGAPEGVNTLTRLQPDQPLIILGR